ncbi:MAG: hypothetical protein AB7P31_00605 [Steroidobacteraceae bacterium]
MTRRAPHHAAHLPLAGLLAALVGCATTAPQAPPAVAAQPRALTTAEAVAEGNGHRSPQRHGPGERTTDEIQASNAAAAAPLDARERLDHAHDRVYTRMQELVEATDRRFARKNAALLAVPAAPFRVGLGGEAIDRSDGTDFDLDLDFDVTLRLPNTEKRLRVFITSNDVDEAPRAANEDTAVRAGLRYEFRRHLNFDVGLKLDVPPVAFVSLKWAREIELGRWDIYPFAKLFAETEESVGYATAITFDRWSGQRLLRTSSYVKWRDDRDRTEWSQTLIYAKAREIIVPDRYGSYLRASDIGRGWGVKLLANGEDMHGATYYEASIFRKHPTASGWLYWFVEPLVRWDRQYGWQADPGIRIGIDALFWDLARPGRPR